MWRIRQPLEVDLVTLAVPLVEQLSAVFDVVEVPLCHAAARVLDCPGQPVELSLQVPKVHGPMVFPPRHAGAYGRTGPALSGPARAPLAVSPARRIHSRPRPPAAPILQFMTACC